MVPLLRAVPSALEYQTLAQALAAGTVEISEVSLAGSVPDVKVVNTGALPVLMLDGCALVGAKQNRILNLSILVPPKSTLTVPVSCVEQGRWRPEGTLFGEGKAMHFASARARKLEDVTVSMARGLPPRADQAGVWDDVACYASQFSAAAPTGAMQDVYGAVEGGVEALVKPLLPVPGQVGAVFLGGVTVLGMDLFDSPATFAAEFPKIVRSYAVDALGDGAPASPGVAIELARQMLAELVAGAWRAYPGVGLGDDLRLAGPHVVGGALAHAGDVVHLVAFTPRAQQKPLHRNVPPPMPPRFGRH
jgi:hypothetical protein